MPTALLQQLLDHPAAGRLAEAAGEVACHLVGGALRDALLGLAGDDLDAVVERTGDEIAARFARLTGARLVTLGGDRFASYRLLGEGWQLDLWDRQGGTLAADLARRDFTVNSMALALAGGETLDPHGGRADLEARRLRATTDTAFARDALRVLRLARFAGPPWRLRPQPETLRLAARAAPALAEVARERVREELRAILAAASAQPALRVLAAVGLFPAWWSARASGAGALAGVALLDELLERRARTLGCPATAAELAAARAALLAAAVAEESGESPRDVLRRLRSVGVHSAGDVRAAAALLAGRWPPRGEAERRRFLHGAGAAWSLAACVLAARRGENDAERWQAELERLAGLAAREGAVIFDPRPLLDGREVQELLGIPPGPELGAVLEELRAAQVEARIHTREEALRLLGERVRHATDLPPRRSES